MCGIIGLYGDSTNTFQSDKKNFLLEGLFVDALRGQESSGLARLPRRLKENPEIYKRALAGPDFVQTKQALRVVGKINESYGFIAHNRASTRGQIEDENAHPFQYKHITLVHNGTVTNAAHLTNKQCDADSNVDSAQVAWSFSIVEPDDLLPIMKGPFSLVWWDSRDSTLHFARNTDKPMYWAVNPLNDMMYFGSELKMLTWLLERNHIKVKPQAMFTSPDNHYVFKNPKNVEEYTKRPFREPSSKGKKKETNWDKAREKNQQSQGTTQALVVNPLASHSPQRGGPAPTSPSATETPKTTTSSLTTPTITTKTISDNSLALVIAENSAKEGSKSFSRFFTKNGKEHPAESEVIKKGLVGTILASVADAKAKKRTRELIQGTGCEAFKVVIADRTAWKAYSDVDGMGWMFLVSRKANIQVFNVSLAQWAKCCDLPKIPVTIVGSRRTFDDTVFIGQIDMELITKMAAKRHARDEDKDWEGDPTVSSERVDSYDTIEVGALHPRYITLKEFNELVDYGCFNCAHTIVPSEAGEMGWFGPNEEWPLCATCNALPQVRTEMERMEELPVDTTGKVH